MMKTTKILMVIYSAAAIIFGSHSNIYADEAVGYTYSIIDGRAEITGCTGEPKVLEIPESIDGEPVILIRDNAFYRCETLTEIRLPETVSKIGHHAFFGCTSLSTVKLPETLSFIGMGAFSGCTSLSSLCLPDTLTVIPDDCFNGCSELNFVSTGSRIKTIGSRAFYSCGALESLYLPPSADEISSDAFDRSEIVLIGEKKSKAEEFASANGIPFINSDNAVSAVSLSDIKTRRNLGIIGTLLLLSGIVIMSFSSVKAYIRFRREK